MSNHILIEIDKFELARMASVLSSQEKRLYGLLATGGLTYDDADEIAYIVKKVHEVGYAIREVLEVHDD